jgi:hypothetical protein
MRRPSPPFKRGQCLSCGGVLGRAARSSVDYQVPWRCPRSRPAGCPDACFFRVTRPSGVGEVASSNGQYVRSQTSAPNGLRRSGPCGHGSSAAAGLFAHRRSRSARPLDVLRRRLLPGGPIKCRRDPTVVVRACSKSATVALNPNHGMTPGSSCNLPTENPLAVNCSK